MNAIHPLLHAAALLAASQILSAAVPSTINYQGRLTNAAGIPQPGTHSMSLKVYDAATAGTQLYTESIGSVTADANGVYSFQFGAAGTSNALVTETIATTDGIATTYQKALANTPVIAGSASVTDGTYNWNELTGNPGAPASATANVVSGFVVGATVTNGGSGYTSAPVVTITGNGTGATATATVASGSVSAINIINAGSGYTTGATISIAPPPAPFVVNYSGGVITANYASAPAANKSITATYRYSSAGITGAIANGSEQWLELTIDGVVQTPRQKVLTVPFAVKARSVEPQEKIWRPAAIIDKGSDVSWTLPMRSSTPNIYNTGSSIIPGSFKTINNIHFDFVAPRVLSSGNYYFGGVSLTLVRSNGGVEEILYSYDKTATHASNGRIKVDLPQNIAMDPDWVYKIRLFLNGDTNYSLFPQINDVRLTVTE